MRKSLAAVLAALLVSPTLALSTPALAGSLTFDNGVTTWHSTQCPRPTPPAALSSANPETSGEDMNTLIGQHNAYVDAAQAYLNCLSDESEHDQTMVTSAIASSAQKEMASMQSEVNGQAGALKRKD